jgi:hypothetical protein
MPPWGGEKTRIRKSKNDHGSAVTQKMSQISDVFTRGQTVYFLPHKYKVLPSHSTFKPKVNLLNYLDPAFAFTTPSSGDGIMLKKTTGKYSRLAATVG